MSSRYPSEFERYWNNSRCKRDTKDNPSDKRVVYNGWRAGQKIRDYELDVARASGCAVVMFREKFREEVEGLVQETIQEGLHSLKEKLANQLGEQK